MSQYAGPTLVASEIGAKIPDWLRLAVAAEESLRTQQFVDVS